MRRATPVTFLSIVAVIMACGDPVRPTAGGDPSGAYGYLARSGLMPVVTGTVTLLVNEDSTVTGSWELQRVPGSDPAIQVGPQLGAGTLAGRLNASGIVAVDLNPGWADYNVFLALEGESLNALTGDWTLSTLIGPVAGGSAELRRLAR
jgi:hypothetical protein